MKKILGLLLLIVCITLLSSCESSDWKDVTSRYEGDLRDTFPSQKERKWGGYPPTGASKGYTILEEKYNKVLIYFSISIYEGTLEVDPNVFISNVELIENALRITVSVHTTYYPLYIGAVFVPIEFILEIKKSLYDQAQSLELHTYNRVNGV